MNLPNAAITSRTSSKINLINFQVFHFQYHIVENMIAMSVYAFT